jgi:putative transposase
LIKLGHQVAHPTAWEIPNTAAIDPTLRRSGPTRKQFPTAQARTVIATDFLHVDTVLQRRIYVPVFIKHHTRRLHTAGITTTPDGAWTAQQARNPAMSTGTRLAEMRFPIRDRGGQFTDKFDAVFQDCALRILKSLRTVLTEFQTHYNSARPHQGIGQHVPDHDPDQPTAHVIDPDTARIHRRPVLAGLTSEYQVAA